MCVLCSVSLSSVLSPARRRYHNLSLFLGELSLERRRGQTNLLLPKLPILGTNLAMAGRREREGRGRSCRLKLRDSYITEGGPTIRYSVPSFRLKAHSDPNLVRY